MGGMTGWMTKDAKVCGGRRKLERSATSDYTTAESSTLDDFQCQICLGPVKQCVSLEPCGHNWCATCLSHHFASLLQVHPPLPVPHPSTPPCPSVPPHINVTVAVIGDWIHWGVEVPNTGLIWRPATHACLDPDYGW